MWLDFHHVWIPVWVTTEPSIDLHAHHNHQRQWCQRLHLTRLRKRICSLVTVILSPMSIPIPNTILMIPTMGTITVTSTTSEKPPSLSGLSQLVCPIAPLTNRCLVPHCLSPSCLRPLCCCSVIALLLLCCCSLEANDPLPEASCWQDWQIHWQMTQSCACRCDRHTGGWDHHWNRQTTVIKNVNNTKKC